MSLPETTFTLDYAFKYDAISASGDAKYNQESLILAQLGGGIQNHDRLIEIGSGTGNSTIVFAESNPDFGQIDAIEPSAGFLTLARYKFGQGELAIPPETIVDQNIINFIEAQKKRTLPYRQRVCFHHSPAQKMSEILQDKKGEIDGVYATQVFHWLTFADDDTQGSNRDYLDVSIRNVSEMLKTGGRFVFDTSGHQMDFGKATLDGRPLKEYHPLLHPYHLAFIDKFNQVLRENEFDGIELNPNKLMRYHNSLDLEFIQKHLALFGLETIPIEDKPYKLTMFPMDKDAVLIMIINGAQMRYFYSPQLETLSSEAKNKLVEEAQRRTMMESADLLDLPSYEIVASFLAKKVA